jgi:hypothetical protein
MDYSKLLEANFKALDHSTDQLTLFFQGEAGIGKTSLIKSYAKNNNLPLIIMNLSAIDASDFTGIPYNDNGVMRYSKPSFLTLDHGIIFLDEINRLNDHDVKSALLSLLVDRKINGHELSNKVLIVTAGNTSSDEYDVNDFDKALEARLVKVKFTRTYTEFINYLESKHERSNLLDFYKLHSDSLKSFDFRRLEFTLNFIESSNLVEALNYYLSPSVFTLFTEYLNKNLFNFSDLIEGKIKKKELDSSAEKKLLFDLKDALKDDFNFSETQAKNVNAFLNNIRAENKQLFFKDLQELALKDKNFEAKKANWKKLELFKGLKEFLDVYLS